MRNNNKAHALKNFMKMVVMRQALMHVCLFLLAMTVLFPFHARATENACVSCHEALDGNLAEPVKHFKSDVHAVHEFSCHSCHGGNPNEMDPSSAMDPAKGFVGKPSRKDIPKFCGKCHSNPAVIRKYNPSMRVDQVELYHQSLHGKKLAAGDGNVATCVDCHGVHGIKPVKDVQSPVYPSNVPKTCAKCHADKKLMAKYGLPGTEFEEYAQSVHGLALLKKQDTSSPACNDCHGNHGALPPGVLTIQNVCGQCHVGNAALFEHTKMKLGYEKRGFPLCLTCHGTHGIKKTDDSMLGVSTGALCIRCHQEGSIGYEMAKSLREEIEKLKQKIEQAESTLAKAENLGMDVEKAKADLANAHTQLVKARHEIHSFSVTVVQKETKSGIKIAKASLKTGEHAIRESLYRRKGLVVYLIASLLLAGAVYLKMREADGS